MKYVKPLLVAASLIALNAIGHAAVSTKFSCLQVQSGEFSLGWGRAYTNPRCLPHDRKDVG